MLHPIIIALHVVGSIGALIAGFLAFKYPNGTPRHRTIGKSYLAMWTLLAVTGFIIGWPRAGFSPVEAVATLGVLSTIYAYAMVLLRKRIGRAWLQRHYTWMMVSLALAVVATVNQLCFQLGISYPLWVFGLMCLSPAFIVPLLRRRLNQRYGFARAQAVEAKQAA